MPLSKQNNSDEGSYSGKNWRAFERIVFDILLDEFGIEESATNHETSAQNDGGYDGIFYAPFSIGGQQSFGKLIFEAKLRGCSDDNSRVDRDLPISDFSKALVIAINVSADKLVVATNLRFSDKTIERLQSFSNQTGLAVQLKCGSEILASIDKGRAKRLQRENDALYQLLLRSAENKAVQKEILPSREKVFANRVDSVTTVDIKNARALALSRFQQGIGLMTIYGAAGSGKTEVIKNILSAASEDVLTSTIVLDLRNCKTPRVLFSHLACALWCIDLCALDAWTTSEIENALPIGDDMIRPEEASVIAAALKQSDKYYKAHADTLEDGLVRYLVNITKKRARRRRMIVCFQNANYLDDETLDFLGIYVRRASAVAGVIVEARTDVMANSRRLPACWSSFVDELKEQSDGVASYEVMGLANQDEAAMFIEHYMQPVGINSNLCAAITAKAGFNPLIVREYVSMIKTYLEIGAIHPDTAADFVLNEPFVGEYEILNRRVEVTVATYQKENQTALLMCLYYLSVADGHLTDQELLSLIGPNWKSQTNALIDTCSFTERRNGKLHLIHDLYMGVIREHPAILRSQKEVWSAEALQMRPCILMERDDSEDIFIRLCKDAAKYNEAFRECVSYAQKLLVQEQYRRSLRYFDEAAELRRLIDENEFDSRYMFEFELGRFTCRLSSEEYDNSDAMKLPGLWEELTHLSDRTDMDDLRLLEQENRYYHYLGRYSDSLSTTARMVEIVESGEFDEERAGAIWVARCIAIKETSSLDESLKHFRAACKKYPGSRALRFSRLTHLSSRQTTRNPRSSQRFLKLIADMYDSISLADRYHNEVNLASNLFLRREYVESRKKAVPILRETYYLGMKSEEGRISNILACLDIADLRYSDAIMSLRHAIERFDRGGYAAHAWPPKANYVSLAIAQDRYFDADTSQFAEECLETLFQYRDRLVGVCLNGPHYEKTLVGLSILSAYYNAVGRHAKFVSAIAGLGLHDISDFFEQHASYGDFMSLYSDTPYVHNGVICVKS